MRLRLVGRLGEKGVRLALREGTSVLGSAPECDLRLDHPTVSRAHAELTITGEAVTVRDLDSRNGTFVGERRVTTHEVAAGARISFGQVRLTLERVEQDDLVTAAGTQAAPGFEAPEEIRADQIQVRGDIRLPYLKFNRNPGD